MTFSHATAVAALLLINVAAFAAEKDFPALDHIVASASPSTQEQAARDLIKRLVPAHAHKFMVSVDPSIGPKFKDTFKITNGGSGEPSIHITGTTGVGVAMGFYYYIKKYCNAHISWAGDQVNLPDNLPKVPDTGITITSNDRFRYYLNVCTVSYSMVWWNYTRWQKEIDWMAMTGINFALAFNGQEAIWNRIYLKMQFTQAELDVHFSGPGFLAWERMGNIEAWAGPLTQNWHNQQVALQHKILQGMRSIGIIPILPAFAGHVPKAINRVLPKAQTYRLKAWNRFGTKNSSTTFLEPTDPYFQKIGKAFLDEYIKEFGTDHVYNCDSFNEMIPRSSDPAYLKGAGAGVYGGMLASDPKAIWVMQGWLFWENRSFWKTPQVKALLGSIPIGHMIVLDLFSEVKPMYQNFESFYGQPFIWNMLHNFGGTIAMYGTIESIHTGPFKGRSYPNSTMIGIGLTPEGTLQNDVIYEFMMEHLWRREPTNLTEWFSNYGTRRYGKYNENISKAWQLLMRSVLNSTDGQEKHGHGENIIVLRPTYQHPRKPDIWYNVSDVYTAWDYFTKAADGFKDSDLFRYDLVDVTRQSLQLKATSIYHYMIQAAKANYTVNFLKRAAQMLDLLDDMETLLQTDVHFLMGRWIADARALGVTEDEKNLYEMNMRNQLTIWGPQGQLIDYANRQFAGLMKFYYKPRWQLYITRLNQSLFSGKEFSDSAFSKAVLNAVEIPFTYANTSMTPTPIGDQIEAATRVYNKWRPIVDEQSTHTRGHMGRLQRNLVFNMAKQDVLVQ